jgi:hypothetical protein
VSIGAFMGALWCAEKNVTTMTQKAREWSKVSSFYFYLYFMYCYLIQRKLKCFIYIGTIQKFVIP